MDATEPAQPAHDYSRRAPAPAARRLPAGRVPLRPARSCETPLNPRAWACADCMDIMAWRDTDHTHGVPLCRSCARRRRTDPPPEDNFDLAGRLTLCQLAIKEQLLTAYALLEGTAYEAEAREWGGMITGALEAPGIDVPARTMSHTIARIREPFIHGGTAW